MKTVGEIRHSNLLLLLAEHGSLAALNEKLGLPRTDATLSQIKNQNKESRTQKPRWMGDAMARRIESALNLPHGWMDNLQYAPSSRDGRIAHALKVMEGMEEWQVDQAIKILGAIAEPTKRNGTAD